MTGKEPAEFGRTWWGRAWLEALEQRARLDPDRLPRGRDYARSGAVGDLTLAPGEARAQVQGRKTEPYQVRIRVRRFTDDEWDRVLEAISARLGHAAALLDGELPPEIADDVAAAGLDLLPGGGELGPRCSCPDDADPCKHSAAACYLLTDALDADPFALFLLRGRTRDQVLAGIRTRRRGAASGQASASEARDDWSSRCRDAIIARPVHGRRGRGRQDGVRRAGPLGADPRRAAAARAARASGGASGGSATVAVRSPRRLAGTGRGCGQPGMGTGDGLSADAGLTLDSDADLARRAARALGTPAFATLVARCGVGSRDLARQALAWRQGGMTGLETLRGTWNPAAEDPDALELLIDGTGRAAHQDRRGGRCSRQPGHGGPSAASPRPRSPLVSVHAIGRGLGTRRLTGDRSGPGRRGSLT